MSILEASKTSETLLAYFLNRLLSDRPEMNRDKVLLSGILNLPDVGEIPIDMVEVDKDELIANLQPWLVLSHLATIPFVNHKDSPNLYFQVLATVGAFSGILRRPDDFTGLRESKGFHVHYIPRYGNVLCGQMGIYEPITYAITNAFYNFPRDMIRLSQWAVEQDAFHLANRILIAAKATITSTDKKVSQSATNSKEILRKYVDDALKRAGGFHPEGA